MFEIKFTSESLNDLIALKKNQQVKLLDAIEMQLRHQPIEITRNRKHLRPNEFAEWELRVGKFRVFYNVNKERLIVNIEAIGFKIGNLLFIRGERKVL
ncbi:MAG TPA: plasmid stabilization protein ParE [Desulfobacteraceae bacterium]|nr:plasmid stabilization protein ParE [Desulfobacteraceae bacterium]